MDAIAREFVMSIQPPLAYRWLKASGISRLLPWHFMDGDQGQAASDRFAREHRGGGRLYTFARRQDCDNFAGFTVFGEQATDHVIYYHPSFQGNGVNPDIVTGTYPDLWTFLREVVIPDTADWCGEENFEFFFHPKT